MKKILAILVLSLFIFNLNTVSAYTEKEKLSADFLSYKDIINTQENGEGYKLDKEITRREMAKVTLNLSGVLVRNQCSGKFSDLKSGDWGCKYVEAGLSNSFFAQNNNFNPDNNISKIEALKMVMKGRKIEKEITDDWREGYVNSALKAGLLEEKFYDYNTRATRGWIFIMAKQAIEYSGDDEDIKLIEELLNL